MLRRNFFFLLITAVIFLTAAKATSASEGIAELKSNQEQNSRCYVLSIFKTDNHYHLLTTCRGLVYPPSPEALHYLVWANPRGEDGIFRLGELGYGKMSAKTKTAFSRLFVTKEVNNKAKQPSGEMVMSGDVKPIAFFEGEITPAVILEENGQSQEAFQPEKNVVLAAANPPIAKKVVDTTKSSMFVVVAGLVGLGFLVFVATRRA